MGALPDLTSLYKVTAAGVVIDRGMCITENPNVLWGPPNKRGNSLTVPRADGAVPMPQRLTERVDSLRLTVIGDVDPAGAAAANPANQVLTNLFWLETNVYSASPGADNCVALKVEGPNAFTRYGRIQFTSFDWEPMNLTTYRVLLGFRIPQRLTVSP